MKRDMDLVRNILLAVEDKDNGDGNWVKLEIPDAEPDALTEHLFLMDEAGLLEGNNVTSMQHRSFMVRRLTWWGHDFLDNIRDPSIWEKTKEGAEIAGGFSLDILAALAKGFVKKKVEEHTGIELDI